MPFPLDKHIRVVIVEDDPYARDIITLLLIRDWRIQVVGEGDADVISRHLGHTDPNLHATMVIIDAEHPLQADWLEDVITRSRTADKKAKIVLVSAHWQPTICHLAISHNCQGYLLKSQIGYGLGWAVAAAAAGRWVCTRTVRAHAENSRVVPPGPRLLLDGREILAQLRGRHRDVARLAVIFNLRHGDIADELGITPGQVNRLVSEVYDIIGLKDILSGQVDPRQHFQNKRVLNRFLRAQHWAENKRPVHQGREKATLAFHLLTLPTMHEW